MRAHQQDATRAQSRRLGRGETERLSPVEAGKPRAAQATLSGLGAPRIPSPVTCFSSFQDFGIGWAGADDIPVQKVRESQARNSEVAMYRNAMKRQCIWYAHDLRDGDAFSRLSQELFEAFGLQVGLFLYSEDFSRTSRRGRPFKGGIPKFAGERFEHLRFIQAMFNSQYSDIRDLEVSLAYTRFGSCPALYFSVADSISSDISDEEFYDTVFGIASKFEFISLGFSYYRDFGAYKGGFSPVKYFNGFSALPKGEEIPPNLYNELVRLRKGDTHCQDVMRGGKLRNIYEYNFIRRDHVDAVRSAFGSEIDFSKLNIGWTPNGDSCVWRVLPADREKFFKLLSGAEVLVYKKFCTF